MLGDQKDNEWAHILAGGSGQTSMQIKQQEQSSPKKLIEAKHSPIPAAALKEDVKPEGLFELSTGGCNC